MSIDYTSAYANDKFLSPIRVSGEIDVSNVQSFRDQLNWYIENTRDDIVLDFKHLKYIDSQGLNILIVSLKKLLQEQRKIIIQSANDNIKHLIKIIALDKYVTLIS